MGFHELQKPVLAERSLFPEDDIPVPAGVATIVSGTDASDSLQRVICILLFPSSFPLFLATMLHYARSTFLCPTLLRNNLRCGETQGFPRRYAAEMLKPGDWRTSDSWTAAGCHIPQFAVKIFFFGPETWRNPVHTLGETWS